MKLPKKYLSFSQIELWIKSPESYRKRYYPEIAPPQFTTVYMAFGNEVTEAMERNEPHVAFIPRHKTFELKLEVEVEGVPILAFVDNIDMETIAFNEQKTTMTSWSENKIKKHIQLDIYSLLLQIKFGRVTDECNLVWAGTRKKEHKERKRGFDNNNAMMELTGDHYTKRS